MHKMQVVVVLGGESLCGSVLPAVLSTTLCKGPFDVFSHSVTRPKQN